MTGKKKLPYAERSLAYPKPLVNTSQALTDLYWSKLFSSKGIRRKFWLKEQSTLTKGLKPLLAIPNQCSVFEDWRREINAHGYACHHWFQHNIQQHEHVQTVFGSNIKKKELLSLHRRLRLNFREKSSLPVLSSRTFELSRLAGASTHTRWQIHHCPWCFPTLPGQQMLHLWILAILRCQELVIDLVNFRHGVPKHFLAPFLGIHCVYIYICRLYNWYVLKLFQKTSLQTPPWQSWRTRDPRESEGMLTAGIEMMWGGTSLVHSCKSCDLNRIGCYD